jgi:toxin ParE1/3/4
MPEILIRPRAHSDLKAIWRYSFQQWGERQADLYLKQLDDGIQSLREFPDLGEACDHIRTGYRKLQVNRHLVFYRRSDQRIEVVRVLHQAMDVGRHL